VNYPRTLTDLFYLQSRLLNLPLADTTSDANIGPESVPPLNHYHEKTKKIKGMKMS
jgi:hypothetical protein